MKNHLLIVAKNPFGGSAKTRLAREMGEDVARGIYARLLYGTLFRVIDHHHGQSEIFLYLSDPSGIPFFRSAFPELSVVSQSAGHLGRRLTAALRESFSRGAEKAIVMASDIPDINWSHIETAFDRIDPNTTVIGPSSDGGFYLFGSPNTTIDFLDGVTWSTNRVFSQVRENINQHGFNLFLLPERRDIDYQADWKIWLDNYQDK